VTGSQQEDWTIVRMKIEKESWTVVSSTTVVDAYEKIDVTCGDRPLEDITFVLLSALGSVVEIGRIVIDIAKPCERSRLSED